MVKILKSRKGKNKKQRVSTMKTIRKLVDINLCNSTINLNVNGLNTTGQIVIINKKDLTIYFLKEARLYKNSTEK